MSEAAAMGLTDLPRAAEPLLVTGATGVVGGRLLTWLSGAGVPVRALLRPGRDPVEVTGDRVEVVHADLLDPDDLRRACEGCWGVVHAAAVVSRKSHGPGKTDERTAWRINAQSPGLLYRAAASAGVRRFVHLSTSGVHGPLSRWPIDEAAPLRADTYYRRGKQAGEIGLSRAAAECDGPAWSILRLSTIGGPGAASVWRGIVGSVVRQRVRLAGRADRPCHPVDIDDACQAILRALTAPTSGEAYLIASSQAVPVRDLLAQIAAESGVGFAPRQVLPAWPTRPAVQLATRVRSRIGWEPNVLHSLAFLLEARAYRIDRARQDLGYAPRHETPQIVRRILDAVGRPAPAAAITH